MAPRAYLCQLEGEGYLKSAGVRTFDGRQHHRVAGHGSGEAKVAQLDDASSPHEDVLRLHVPVDDPVRVQIVQGLDLQGMKETTSSSHKHARHFGGFIPTSTWLRGKAGLARKEIRAWL